MKTIDGSIFRLPVVYPKPREILLKHFPSMGEDLPIKGGWGYGADDVVVIDKNDPIVCPDLLFDEVGIEYSFVPKRLYEELIISRPRTDRYSGIRWQLQRQSLSDVNDKRCDILVFDVTAFKNADWEMLKADWESHDYLKDNDKRGLENHLRLRDSLQINFTAEFWFDISSCF